MDSIAVKAQARAEEVAGRTHPRPRRLLVVADLVSAFVSGVAAYLVLDSRGGTREAVTLTLVMGTLIVVGAIVLLGLDGQYAARRRMSRLDDLMSLGRSLLIAAAVVALANYLTKGFFTGNSTPSRIAIGCFLLVFFVAAGVARLVLAGYQTRQFARGQNLKKVLVIGEGLAADDFLSFLAERPWLGVTCAMQFGSVSPSLEGLAELEQTFRTSGATTVVVALDPEQQAQLSEVTKLLTVGRIPFEVVPSLFERTYRDTQLLGYAELPVIDVNVDALDRMQRAVKRTSDVVAASLALIIGLPLIACISLAILVESGRPVIYAQERVGKNGRRFRIYKFRTMIQDADRRLCELEERNEACSDGQIFKMKDDPRVTRLGRGLRKLSLDEFPQFVNVLRGEMSVVGPRPPLPQEVEKYETHHFARLRALPGITGLWQVSGRSSLSFDDMVKLDRYYMDNWSLRMDLAIMLKTIVVVLGRKGAY